MGRVRKNDQANESIFEVLIHEHRDVAALFDQIEAAADEDPALARDLFTVLEGTLLAHARTEERIVYRRLDELDELAEPMQEARREHATIETLLAELREGAPERAPWLDRLAELKEEVERHVAEEEGEVFPVAKDHLDADESRRLAGEYLAAKPVSSTAVSGDDDGRRRPARASRSASAGRRAW